MFEEIVCENIKSHSAVPSFLCRLKAGLIYWGRWGGEISSSEELAHAVLTIPFSDHSTFITSASIKFTLKVHNMNNDVMQVLVIFCSSDRKLKIKILFV